MLRSLKMIVGVRTTLTIGDEVYHGEVVEEERSGHVSRSYHPQMEYYFQTNLRRRIPIGKRNIRIVNGGLALVLDKSSEVTQNA